MKKIFILIAAILGISFSSFANDSYSRNMSELPETAKVILAKNFKSPVSLIKTEKTLGFITEYDVILTDGSEINFDRNGNWSEVEMTANSEVPRGFIIKGINDYVANNFPGQKIVSISKDSGGYEIELTNSIEMKFNRNGKFLRYDD